MGGVCSGGERMVDTGDALSLSEMVVGAGDGAGFPASATRASKKLHKSGDAKKGLGKTATRKIESSIFGRAGIVGLEKAAGVLETFGSSITNLNTGGGFLSVIHRGKKISILAFEVANTIVKGATLLLSFSEESIQFLRRNVLLSNGIQRLVSTDFQELLSIVATDKREELDVFCKEVIRFGNQCKDPQWHNLARYFQKLHLSPTPHQQLKDNAETAMDQLLDLAKHTSELYHELNALDRFEQDYRRKLKEEESLPIAERGENRMILHGELKQQRKMVKILKKRSLWSRNLEEVVEKLVDIVTFVHNEILVAFGQSGTAITNCKSDHVPQRLGSLGLALHYAHIINQIDNAVSQPLSLPPNTRDTLYHGLPATVKTALRSRLRSFHAKEELNVALIKSETHKILRWLVPMAENTVNAHQNFGWVGEWANMSMELDRWPVRKYNITQIETLHHADKEKTEEYILQLAVWLHHLVVQVKVRGCGFNLNSTRKTTQKRTTFLPKRKPDLSFISNNRMPIIDHLSDEEKKMLEHIDSPRLVLGRSRSHNSLTVEKQGRRRWSPSCDSSPSKDLTDSLNFQSKRRAILGVTDQLYN